MKKWLIAGLVIIVILIVVLIVVLAGGGGGGDGDGDVVVPINVQGASNVGSISIEMAYDSTVLEATGVESGELASNAMMEFNIDNPGLVVIGIVDSSGINGDGAVAEVGFNVIDSEGTSSLSLDIVKTHDAESLIDIINETSGGSFIAEDGLAEAPLITFNQ